MRKKTLQTLLLRSIHFTEFKLYLNKLESKHRSWKHEGVGPRGSGWSTWKGLLQSLKMRGCGLGLRQGSRMGREGRQEGCYGGGESRMERALL